MTAIVDFTDQTLLEREKYLNLKGLRLIDIGAISQGWDKVRKKKNNNQSSKI